VPFLRPWFSAHRRSTDNEASCPPSRNGPRKEGAGREGPRGKWVWTLTGWGLHDHPEAAEGRVRPSFYPDCCVNQYNLGLVNFFCEVEQLNRRGYKMDEPPTECPPPPCTQPLGGAIVTTAPESRVPTQARGNHFVKTVDETAAAPDPGPPGGRQTPSSGSREYLTLAEVGPGWSRPPRLTGNGPRDGHRILI